MFKFRGKEFSSLKELRVHLERQPLLLSCGEVKLGGKSRPHINSYLQEMKKEMIDEIINDYNLFFDGQRFNSIGHLRDYLLSARVIYLNGSYSMFDEYMEDRGIGIEAVRATLIERILKRYV